MAYYRTGLDEKHSHLLSYTANNFWRQVNANFLDMCVLEWCKLFADRREKHHCSKIVGAPKEFESRLLQKLEVNDQAFQAQIRIMRTYRDKWVAHLDYDRSGLYPALSCAKRAIWFYYTWVAGREALTGDLDGFPNAKQLDEGYLVEQEAANAVYAAARSGALSLRR